jgi:hypothetical protein
MAAVSIPFRSNAPNKTYPTDATSSSTTSAVLKMDTNMIDSNRKARHDAYKRQRSMWLSVFAITMLGSTGAVAIAITDIYYARHSPGPRELRPIGLLLVSLLGLIGAVMGFVSDYATHKEVDRQFRWGTALDEKIDNAAFHYKPPSTSTATAKAPLPVMLPAMHGRDAAANPARLRWKRAQHKRVVFTTVLAAMGYSTHDKSADKDLQVFRDITVEIDKYARAYFPCPPHYILARAYCSFVLGELYHH